MKLDDGMNYGWTPKQCIHRSFDLSLDFLPELCEIEIMTFLPGAPTRFNEILN